MQIINILGNDCHITRPVTLKSRGRQMGVIRAYIGTEQTLLSFIIKAVNQLRVFLKRFRAGNLLNLYPLQSPPAPRKGARPLSLEIPAPVKITIGSSGWILGKFFMQQPF
jgi:hypothetical protein